MGTIHALSPGASLKLVGITRFLAPFVTILRRYGQDRRDSLTLRHLADDPRLLADVGLTRKQVLDMVGE